jgi:6-methylsalicylate decarboxylase
MMTNYGGKYLGNAFFRPIFAELAAREATIFIHPETPAGYDCVACGRPGPLIEFTFDTCRTVTDLLFAGVFDEFPTLRFVLSHAGGALPALAPRIRQLGTLPWVANPQKLTSEAMAAHFAKLYFDTAIAGSAASLAPVLQLTDPSHIIFGTDYPPASEAVIAQNIRAFTSFNGLTEAQRKAVDSNAIRLFRRLAKAAADG